MKRKVLATFLTACMAVGMLAGCGGQGGGYKQLRYIL